MSTVTSGNVGMMLAPPEAIQVLWDKLRVQISPFNIIICVDGGDFRSLGELDKQWISTQYDNIVLEPSTFVYDCQIDRVFLAPTAVFSDMTSYTPMAGNMPVSMNNSDLSVGPSQGVNPATVETDVNITLAAPARISKIPRPPNAFILYRKDHHESVKLANPGIHNNQISVILGTQWQQESEARRDGYRDQAAQLKEEHKQKYPTYQYQPRKSTDLKRRMTKKKTRELNRAILANDGGTASNFALTYGGTGFSNSLLTSVGGIASRSSRDAVSAWTQDGGWSQYPDPEFDHMWRRYFDTGRFASN